MLKKPTCNLLILLLLTCFSLLSAGCYTLQTTPGTSPLFVSDTSLVTGKLDNGFTYIIMKNKKPADRVSMHLVINAGSMHEADEQRGLAHYLEHMLFNGTENFAPGELVKFFQSIGMAFGGDANAHTGFFETVYDVLLPKGDKKNLSDGLVVMHDYANSALLLESEIEREKNIILAEKRDRDSASYRLFESSIKFELDQMRLVKRLPIGTEACIKKANRKQLKQFYDTWYRPSNMFIVAVGDFDVLLTEKLIRDKFASLEARAPNAIQPQYGEVNHTGIKPFHHYEKEIGKTSVSIETVDDTPVIKDSLDYRKKTIIQALANTILRNRLDAMTKKPETPFTSASASSGFYLRNVKYADISADCSPENWQKSLTVIEMTLRAALEFGFFQDELTQVKANYTAGLKRAVKSAPTRDSSNLANRIIRTFSNGTLFLSPENKLAIFEPFINSLTLDDINRIFKEAWAGNHRLVLVNGNANLSTGTSTPEQKILDVFQKSAAIGVKKPKSEKKVSFPYLPPPLEKGRIKEKKEHRDIGVTTIDFENGVRLNLKQTDYKANQVLYKVIFGNGKKSEPENKPGLASLSTALINESGFGGLNTDELKRALAGKSTSLTFGIGAERFAISGTSISSETELMFQLIRTQLLDPAFRKENYDLIMEKMSQAYTKMESTIDGAEMLHAQSFLAGGDTRFGLPAYKRFTANTIDDVKMWAGKSIMEDQIELSVSGDFDTDTLIEQCALYLGSLSAGKKAYNATLAVNRTNPAFPKGQRLSLSVKTQVPKSLVKIAYQTDDFWDIQRTRRLSALGAVFSDRLRNAIREELGAAYSPHAYNNSSIAYPGYGLFMAVISVEPGQEKLVEEKVKEISTSLATKKIDPDELNRAVDPILTHIKDLRKTNRYWLNSVLAGSGRYPQKLDWAKTIEADYSAITIDEIYNYSRKYLNNNTSATVVIVTEK